MTIERAFLGQLGTGCSLPVGGYVRDTRLYTYLHDDTTGRTADEVVELPDSIDVRHDGGACRWAARAGNGVPVTGTGPLTGRRIVTTRDRPGELDRLLTLAGAEVVHVPLIEIVDVDGVAADQLSAAIAELHRFDWLIVTSRHGAARLGDAAAAVPGLRLAAVGTSTAAELADLAGRPVDLIPTRQTAADLVAAMPAPIGTAGAVLVAQADRAEPTLVDGLRRPRLRGDRGGRVSHKIAEAERRSAPRSDRR